MPTVPKASTVPAEKPRWNVRRSGFPFTAPGPVIGTVEALDRDSAIDLADLIWGAGSVVVDARPIADHG